MRKEKRNRHRLISTTRKDERSGRKSGRTMKKAEEDRSFLEE
jgi:hypothetical protein